MAGARELRHLRHGPPAGALPRPWAARGSSVAAALAGAPGSSTTDDAGASLRPGPSVPTRGSTRRSQSPHEVESGVGAVATDDARCSEGGAAVLRVGRHAVDAAVAAALCLGVVHPMSSGGGSGAFVVVGDAASSDAVAFDARDTAPGATAAAMARGGPPRPPWPVHTGAPPLPWVTHAGAPPRSWAARASSAAPPGRCAGAPPLAVSAR